MSPRSPLRRAKQAAKQQCPPQTPGRLKPVQKQLANIVTSKGPQEHAASLPYSGNVRYPYTRPDFHNRAAEGRQTNKAMLSNKEAIRRIHQASTERLVSSLSSRLSTSSDSEPRPLPAWRPQPPERQVDGSGMGIVPGSRHAGDVYRSPAIDNDIPIASWRPDRRKTKPCCWMPDSRGYYYPEIPDHVRRDDRHRVKAARPPIPLEVKSPTLSPGAAEQSATPLRDVHGARIENLIRINQLAWRRGIVGEQAAVVAGRKYCPFDRSTNVPPDTAMLNVLLPSQPNGWVPSVYERPVPRRLPAIAAQLPK